MKEIPEERPLVSPYVWVGLATNHTAESIIRQVAFIHGYTIENLTIQNKVRELAVPRALALYFAVRVLIVELKKKKLKPKATLAQIGSVIDRDHATVLHNYNKVNTCLDYDVLYQEHYNRAASMFNLPLKIFKTCKST